MAQPGYPGGGQAYYPGTPQATNPYNIASAYSYGQPMGGYPAAYPADYSAGYAPAYYGYQYPNAAPTPAPYQPQIPSQSPYLPPAQPLSVSQSAPTVSPSPIAAAYQFQLTPPLKLQCYVMHNVSSQYLAVDENDARLPPILRAQPQTFEVSFLDEHLVTFKSKTGMYVCCRSSWVMQTLNAGSTKVGDEERFIYYRRDDGVFSIQTSGGKFFTGDGSRVKLESTASVNSTWMLLPQAPVNAPVAAAFTTLPSAPVIAPAPSATPVTQSSSSLSSGSQPHAALATPPSHAPATLPSAPTVTPLGSVPKSDSAYDVDESLSVLAQSQMYIPVAKPQRLPVGPPQDRVSAADETITLVRAAQDEAEATRQSLRSKSAASVMAKHSTQLRDIAVKFRKLKKAVKAVAPPAGCVPVDLLRSAAAGLAMALVRMSNGATNTSESDGAYLAMATAAKSSLQAAEILKTNGPEVLLPDNWDQLTTVNMDHLTPATFATGTQSPSTAPAGKAPATPAAKLAPSIGSARPARPQRAKLSPAEEQQLKSRFKEEAVIRVQKHVRYIIARNKLLKLMKEAKLSKEKSFTAARQRKNVFFEIVGTEQSFGKALAVLCDCYQPVLMIAKDKLMSNEDAASVAHFFGTLQGLRGLNQSLLAELEKRAKAWPAQTSLGDVFLPYIPMMKMFSVYINDYDDFLAMVARLKLSSRNFAEVLTSCKAKSGHTLDFESLIIQPVQRMPRYQLLIKEILKFTDQSHTDFANLTTCLRVFSETNIAINTAKRERDNRMLKVRCVQSIKGLPFDLLQPPSRAYVREGNLGIRKGSDVKHYHVFVFNDMAIFTRQTTRASTDFALMVGFAGLSVNPLGSSNVFMLSGKGVGTDGELVVETGSTGERDAWVKDISSYVELIRLKEKADSATSSGGLQIVRALYGDLGGKHKDVTNQLTQIVAAQGSGGLQLRPESRQALFGHSQAIFGDANKLEITYTIPGMTHVTRTYSDFEEVSLP